MAPAPGSQRCLGYLQPETKTPCCCCFVGACHLVPMQSPLRDFVLSWHSDSGPQNFSSPISCISFALLKRRNCILCICLIISTTFFQRKYPSDAKRWKLKEEVSKQTGWVPKLTAYLRPSVSSSFSKIQKLVRTGNGHRSTNNKNYLLLVTKSWGKPWRGQPGKANAACCAKKSRKSRRILRQKLRGFTPRRSTAPLRCTCEQTHRNRTYYFRNRDPRKYHLSTRHREERLIFDWKKIYW